MVIAGLLLTNKQNFTRKERRDKMPTYPDYKN